MSPSPSRLLINVGCGHQRPAGWINTDCSLNAMLQRIPLLGAALSRLFKATSYGDTDVRYLNLNRRWPFLDGEVDAVYGSHVFEHLHSSKARHFLHETMRVLKPGGVLRLAVPDLYQAAQTYVRNFERGDPKSSDVFLYILNLHYENNYAPDRSLLYRMTHWAQNWPHQHKYMYDTLSLRGLMEEHGIRDVQDASYGFSKLLPEIGEVERTEEGICAIYLEGIKPAF